MNISAYLNRLNYHGTTTPSAETLRALRLAHLLSVPFENLSIIEPNEICRQVEYECRWFVVGDAKFPIVSGFTCWQHFYEYR
jgi:arylamine N-acetyltransferase